MWQVLGAVAGANSGGILGSVGNAINGLGTGVAAVGTHQGAKALARELGNQREQMEQEREKRLLRMDRVVTDSTALAGQMGQRTAAANELQTAAANPVIDAGSTALGLAPGSSSRVKSASMPARNMAATQQAEQQRRMEQERIQMQAESDFYDIESEAARQRSLWAAREAVAAHKGERWRLAGAMLNVGGNALSALGGQGNNVAGKGGMNGTINRTAGSDPIDYKNADKPVFKSSGSDTYYSGSSTSSSTGVE